MSIYSRYANTLSRSLAKGNKILFETFPMFWIHPSLWDEALRVREYVLIVMHKYTCHAHRCLVDIVSKRLIEHQVIEIKSPYPWGNGPVFVHHDLIRRATLKSRRNSIGESSNFSN